MMPRLHVATRKGLFTMERKNGRWSIADTAFLGDPVSMTLFDSRDGTLYAALNLGHFGVKLHRSSDEGKTWTEVAVPEYPKENDTVGEAGGATAPGTEPKSAAPSLKQIWCLEPGGPGETGRLWAGTIPGGLFLSTDRGSSWLLVRSLWDRPERSAWFGGGYDHAGIHSILVDPRDSRHLVLGVSVGGVWSTPDGGDTWGLGGHGMVAAYMPPERQGDPTIQDPHRLVACPGAPDTVWCQHHNGVFKSQDGGANWSEVKTVTPSVFGFAVAVHPTRPDTAWFVPAVKDECRVPVDGKIVVARTEDGGKRFVELRQGLPQEQAFDLVYRHGLDIDASGNRLAMGSTTGSLWATEDGGESWETISAHLPPVYAVRFEK